MLTLRASIAAVLLLLLVPFAPASAGGPTSVILSVPGQGRTAALYYTDDTYNRLAELVGAYETTAGRVDDSRKSHESGTGINVTWLIHDVQPWRIDRIYLDAEGGPWIATQVMDTDTGSIWDSPVVWHRPAGGEELSLLLGRLLDGKAPAPAATVPETPAPAPAPAAPADSSNGVWWGLGGLVTGALLVLGWVRLRPKREDEPELDPDADWLVPQTRSTSA